MIVATALVLGTALTSLSSAPAVDEVRLPEIKPTVKSAPKAPEPAPVVIPPPAPVEPAPVLTGCEAYRALISQYPWDVSIAMAIMEAESKCDPNAVGDTWVIRGLYAPSCGLLQVRTLSNRPACEQLKDPATNVDWSYKLFASGGWSHWTMFKNGTYLRFIKETS